MTAYAPKPTAEQADLVAMLGAFMADQDIAPSDERPDEVAALRRKLAELGVWTLGVPDACGGAGADDLLAATVFAELGRGWAALGWAAVQAHAAAEVLAGRAEFAELVEGIHDGGIAIGVRDSADTADPADTAGFPGRIDAAGAEPYALVLEGADTVRLLGPGDLRYLPLRRTGLGGALTVSAEMTGEGIRVTGVPGDVLASARVRLRLGAASVLAGIADAAAKAAVDYSATRRQFGAPLTALPTVREQLFAASSSAAVLLREVLRGADAEPWQAAAVLDTAAEAAIDACARAVQSHGGYGYLTEYPVERLLRDAISLRAACDPVATRRAGAADVVTS
ncbi:acyl-CoA dehydrogenase family protein [Saccharomonospora sp. NPDC006951]